MALLCEENPFDIPSQNTTLEDLIINEDVSITQISLFISKQNVYQAFMMITTCLEKGQGWGIEKLRKLQEVSLQFFREREDWCDELVGHCRSTIITQILSVGMKMYNRLKHECSEFFENDTFYGYVYWKIFKCETITTQQRVNALKQFQSLKTIEKGIYKVLMDKEIKNTVEILFNYFENCLLQTRIDYISFIYQKVPLDVDLFKNLLGGLSMRNYQIDISLFYDVFNRDPLKIDPQKLSQLTIRLCHLPKSTQIISLLFTLYSNKTYATTSSFSSQWTLTQYIIYILRCIPFNTKASLLSFGVSLRINSPLKKIRDIALVVMDEIESNNKQKRYDYKWDFETTINCDGIDNFTEPNIPIDQSILVDDENKLQGNQETKILEDFQSKIQEVQQQEANERKVKRPIHLLEWLELFDDFGNRRYEEVEMMLSIAVDLIKKSSQFIGPYLEDVIMKVLTIKNVYKIQQFEEWQIGILREIVTNKNIKCKRSGSQIIIEKIMVDREIVLNTMKQCGYYREWIDPLRSYVMEWCYENKFEYNIKQAIDYLKEYGNVAIINDWFVLYRNCRSNDRIVLNLLAGLLQVVSLTSNELFIWSCSEQIKYVLEQLEDDNVNHPNKTIRMTANALLKQITLMLNTEIETENQKDILLF